jgi:hypothetical protein
MMIDDRKKRGVVKFSLRKSFMRKKAPPEGRGARAAEYFWRFAGDGPVKREIGNGGLNHLSGKTPVLLGEKTRVGYISLYLLKIIFNYDKLTPC